MYSWPFESKNTGTSASPVWDRAITAEMERTMRQACYTNGVFATPLNGLMVEANSGMTVMVNPGACNIQGAIGVEETSRTFTLEAASASLNRIDRIVARFDTAEDVRSVELYLKQGSPATNPAAPELVRSENYYELALADIRIPAGTTDITNSLITDQRMNGDVCGMVIPAIPYEDQASELWLQVKESIDLVNAAIDETVAGNLQLEIDGLDSRLTSAEAEIDGLDSRLTSAETEITDAETDITNLKTGSYWRGRLSANTDLPPGDNEPILTWTELLNSSNFELKNQNSELHVKSAGYYIIDCDATTTTTGSAGTIRLNVEANNSVKTCFGYKEANRSGSVHVSAGPVYLEPGMYILVSMKTTVSTFVAASDTYTRLRVLKVGE